jgi:hypothetical protein
MTRLDLTTFKPDVRKFIIEESAKLRGLKETSVKRARQDLDAQLRLVRSLKLQKKVLRIELLHRGGVSHRQEVAVVKHAWLTVLALLSSSQCLHRAFNYKAALRVRSEHLLKLVFYIFRIVGRVRLKLRQRRFARSVTVIKRHLPLLRGWIAVRRKVNTEAVNSLVDRFLSGTVLRSLFLKWRSKVSRSQILFLQEGLKKWKGRRKGKPRRSQVK